MVGAIVEIAGVAHRVGTLPAQADRPLPARRRTLRPGPAAAKEGETRKAEGHGDRRRMGSACQKRGVGWPGGRTGGLGTAEVHACRRQRANPLQSPCRSLIQAMGWG
jgi:hypothetical protein